MPLSSDSTAPAAAALVRPVVSGNLRDQFLLVHDPSCTSSKGRVRCHTCVVLSQTFSGYTRRAERCQDEIGAGTRHCRSFRRSSPFSRIGSDGGGGAPNSTSGSATSTSGVSPFSWMTAPSGVRYHAVDSQRPLPSGSLASVCSAARPLVRSPTRSARLLPASAAANSSAGPDVPHVHEENDRERHAAVARSGGDGPAHRSFGLVDARACPTRRTGGRRRARRRAVPRPCRAGQ